jgi:hypothetical protein
VIGKDNDKCRSCFGGSFWNYCPAAGSGSEGTCGC